MRKLLSIFTALLLLPASAVRLAPWSPDATGQAPARASVRAVVGEGAREFDEGGNLLSASNAVAREQFAYDARDRLVAATTIVAGVSFPLRWRRDAGGLVTNLVYATGRTLTRTYDADGRLASVRDWLGHVWTFAHDGAGRPAGGASPDGTAHGFAYDAAGRLAGWHAGTLAGRAIERDAAGRRVRDTVTAGPMPRSSVDRRAVNAFDAADRLVSASVVYAVTNAPVAETYAYDGNGALTSFTSNGETLLALSYDALGRLAAMAPGGASGGGFACAYDALGNRVLADGRLWIPDHADPLRRPLLECAADGTVLRHYLWGDGRLLGFVDATNGLTVAHSDEQGGVVALTAPDGTLLHTAVYGPHGEDWGTTGVNPTPFAWLGGLGVRRIAAGRANGAADGCRIGPLYLTRHRLYSATLRRFLSADPLGPAGGLNVYAYANGDPLAYVDPLGLCAEGGEAGFFENLAVGAVEGDFAGDTGWGGAIGQIGVGLIPVVGQVADARDTAANTMNVWNEPSSGAAWVGLAMSGVAWVPGLGDAVKGLVKGGKQAVKTVDTVIDTGSKQLRRLSNGEIKTLKRGGIDPHDLKIDSLASHS